MGSLKVNLELGNVSFSGFAERQHELSIIGRNLLQQYYFISAYGEKGSDMCSPYCSCPITRDCDLCKSYNVDSVVLSPFSRSRAPVVYKS